MHSLILLDEEKTPLSRMITWADNRAADEAEKLKYTVLGKEFYRQTGTSQSADKILCQARYISVFLLRPLLGYLPK